MNKMYTIALSSVLLSLSSLVNTSDNQHPYNTRFKHNNIKKNLQNSVDVSQCTFQDTYVASTGTYTKPNTQRSKSAGSKADSNKGLRG